MQKKSWTMDVKEFKELPEERQLDILQTDGVYIGKRFYDDLFVMLYQLHGFYVEVFYEEYRVKIDHIVVSDSTDIMLPYLDQIKVRDLKDPTKES